MRNSNILHAAVLACFVPILTATVFSQSIKPTSTVAAKSTDKSEVTEKKPKKKVVKTDAQWRKQLSRMQYKVTRQGHTEPPRTGRLWRHKEKGTYHCICCDEPLFSSKTKYKSGTGWPSFYAPLDKDQIATKVDRSVFSLGPRIEVLCRRCDAHLGHVFSDGPRPTGLRYCLNSAALKFQREKKKKEKNKEASKEDKVTETGEASSSKD